MSNLVFTANKTLLEGKQGKLKLDKDGCYECLVGAYNVPNNIGETYVFSKRVENLFTKSTAITKLDLNQLFGEADHPGLDEYRSKTRSEREAIALWINRLRRIAPDRIAHQIMGIRWEAMPKKVDGRTVYGVYNKVKPINEILKALLDDPLANTAFSVRSFVDRSFNLGEVICEAKDLITWDWVPHGGIKMATKYGTPSLESENKLTMLSESAPITQNIITDLDNLQSSDSLVGNESDLLFDTTVIRDLAGWRQVPDLTELVSRSW